MASQRYRALTGLNYPSRRGGPEKRVEAGETVTDLPATSVGWLLGQGLIEPADDEGGEG